MQVFVRMKRKQESHRTLSFTRVHWHGAYEMIYGYVILDAWYDRVSFTRETSTMHDYLNRLR